MPLNDCCRTSYRHASRFRTVAGSSSYALGSAFGTVRRRSDATGALLATQVPASGKSHDLAVEPRDQPILPLSELLSFSLSFLFFSPFFHAHRSLSPAEYSVFTKGGGTYPITFVKHVTLLGYSLAAMIHLVCLYAS